MPFDMRPDKIGWTVYDVLTGRAVLLEDVKLVELELEDANALVNLLNRRAAQGRSVPELGLTVGLPPTYDPMRPTPVGRVA